MRKRRREREWERKKREGSKDGACFIEGCFISTATRLRLSRTRALCSLSLSLSLSLDPLRLLFIPHDLSHPMFLPNPVECKQRTRNPLANLHLITTITTGDSRETTSSPYPPLLSRPLRWFLPKQTHAIAFRTIGSRSSLWRWYPARFSLTKYFAFHCATGSHAVSISGRILTMKNSSYVFCSLYFFLLQLIASKKGMI